jgi:hypothetical protein
MLFSEGVDFCVGRNSVFKTGGLNGSAIPAIKSKSSKNMAVAFDRKKTPINPPACNSDRKLQQINSIVQRSIGELEILPPRLVWRGRVYTMLYCVVLYRPDPSARA